MQYGSVQRISVDAAFATQQIGIYAAVEQDEIYLYDTLGRKLQTDVDGNYLYGDRIFKMSETGLRIFRQHLVSPMVFRII